MRGVERHRAAMVRNGLSRPVRLALEHGFVRAGEAFFDYGCGRGADVSELRAMGLTAMGWDPHFAPDEPHTPASVVNLGYVINVIEDPIERLETLKAAWALAEKLLVVSARLANEAEGLIGSHYADGVLTRRGTFQKFFEQGELRDYIEQTLGVMPVPAAPGVFFVFRDEGDRQTFLLSRYRRVRLGPSVRRPEDLYEAHREFFEPLLAYFEAKGRMPTTEELPLMSVVLEKVGSVQRVIRTLERVLGSERLEAIRAELRDDLLVYLALARFERRPAWGQLPAFLQLDIKSVFSTYKEAFEAADTLLFSAGQSSKVDAACRASTIGKLTPEALYVHVSALEMLSPILRVYEGCARRLVGRVDDTNLIKLVRLEPKVSYLAYPNFDDDPHPALKMSLRVHLQSFDLKYRDFSQTTNPPILHRKETFIAADYPGRDKFTRLTLQEEKCGLYDEPRRIGTRDGWAAALAARGVELKGHRVVRRKAGEEPKS